VKPKNVEKNLPHCHLSTTNHTQTGLALNPGLPAERPVTNRLSHSTASFRKPLSQKAQLIKHHVRKTYRGVDIMLHAFLAPQLSGKLHITDYLKLV
jgi:hypothetical protein